MQRSFLVIAFLLMLCANVVAQTSAVPPVMNFQGRLAKPNGTPVLDGNYQITLSLFATSTGGTPLWTQAVNPVVVQNGVFAVKLNLATGFTGINTLDSTFASPPYLEIKIGNDTPLTPRQPFVSSAYAFRSKTAEVALNVAPGSISLSSLANGVLTFNNIGGQVIGSQITNGTITLSDLDSNLANTLTALTSSPAQTLRGSISTGSGYQQGTVAGNYAYIVNYSDSTLKIFDVSNPANPSLLSSVDTGGNYLSVAVSGNYAYVLVNYSAPGSIVSYLKIFDVRDPIHPVVKSITLIANDARSVVVSGNHAYIVSTNNPGTSPIPYFDSGRLQIIDISNPVAPSLKSTTETVSGVSSIAVSDHHACVVGRSSLQIFDISNPNSCALKGSGTVGYYAGVVAVLGRYVYVGTPQPPNGGGYIRVFDVVDPAHPVITSDVACGAYPQNIVISGNYAYVPNYGDASVQVFDLSNPSSPSLKSTTSIGSNLSPGSVAVAGNSIYVFSYSYSESGSLQIFDIFGTTHVAGNLSTTGNATISGNLTVPSATIALLNGSVDVGNNLNVTGNGSFNGNVGIGVITPQYRLDVNGDINASGNVRANGLALSSDARYKTNIATINNALDDVLRLRGVLYDWKYDEFKSKHFPSGRQVGFIAQELEQIFPELVFTDSDGYKSVAYANVIPVLVEAIKQQEKKIEAQQMQIDELKKQNAEIAELKRQLAALFGVVQQNSHQPH